MKRLLISEERKDIAIETKRTTIVTYGGCAKKEANFSYSS